MSYLIARITRKGTYSFNQIEQKSQRYFYASGGGSNYTPAVGDTVTFFQPVRELYNTGNYRNDARTSDAYKVAETGEDYSGNNWLTLDDVLSYNRNPAERDDLEYDPQFSRFGRYISANWQC